MSYVHTDGRRRQGGTVTPTRFGVEWVAEQSADSLRLPVLTPAGELGQRTADRPAGVPAADPGSIPGAVDAAKAAAFSPRAHSRYPWVTQVGEYTQSSDNFEDLFNRMMAPVSRVEEASGARFNLADDWTVKAVMDVAINGDDDRSNVEAWRDPHRFAAHVEATVNELLDADATRADIEDGAPPWVAFRRPAHSEFFTQFIAERNAGVPGRDDERLIEALWHVGWPSGHAAAPPITDEFRQSAYAQACLKGGLSPRSHGAQPIAGSETQAAPGRYRTDKHVHDLIRYFASSWAVRQ